MKQKRILPFVPVIVDVIAVLLLLWLLPTAVSRFSEVSGSNAAVLTAVFILMCAGVYIVRKLEARETRGKLTIPTFLLDRRLHIVSAVAFALLFVTMLAAQFGYFDAIFSADTLTLGEGEASALFVFAPGAWLALAFMYVIVLVLKVTPTIGVDNGRYPWLTFFALIFINLMLITMTAQFAVWTQLLDLAGDWFLGLIVFGLLALLFGPPRWLYLCKQPDLGGDLTSLALWVLCAWMVIR
ncbi:MAG: hypothetical protein GWP17_03845 [Aquificales bacterium]|nr:hypothetical protein [Aquificales bacterium]